MVHYMHVACQDACIGLHILDSVPATAFRRYFDAQIKNVPNEIKLVECCIQELSKFICLHPFLTRFYLQRYAVD